MQENSYAYLLSANEKMLVNLSEAESPFSNTKTRILRPTLNNERIIAQAGWFTAHKFSRSQNRFIELEAVKKKDLKLLKLKLNPKSKNKF